MAGLIGQRARHAVSNGGGNAQIFTVPNDKVWRLLYAHAVVTTVSGGSARQIVLRARDGDDATVFDNHAGVVQTAGESDIHYEFMTGTVRESARVATSLTVAFPLDFYLLPGWDLVILDDDNINVTDSIEAHIVYEEIPVH